MSSEYKANGTGNGNPNNGMIDRRTAIVGGLSALLGACAGPARWEDVPEKYKPHVEEMDARQPDSIKITQQVDNYLSQSTDLPLDPEKLVYDVNRANGVLSPQERATLDKVVMASTYIKTLDEHGALPHLYIEYLDEITNENLKDHFKGYSQKIANDAEDYITRINGQLGITRQTSIRSQVKDLREKIGKLADGQVKTELKAVMTDFDVKTEGLQNALTYLMAAGRNFGHYKLDHYDSYRNLQLARTGDDPYEVGEKVLTNAGIDVKKLDSDLEKIASDGTKFDMRKHTHALRTKFTDFFIDIETGKVKTYIDPKTGKEVPKMPAEDYMDGLYRVISAERSQTNRAKADSGVNIVDSLPVIGLFTGLGHHIEQSSGYEGIDVSKPQDIGKILMADYAGATDAPINMDANENRAAVGLAIGSTLLAIGIGYAIGAATSNKGNSGSSGGSGGAGKPPMGSNPVVQTLTGGRGPRTGGAGAGTR